MFRRYMFLLALLTPFVAACSDDDPTGPSSTDLEGTWTVTRIEFVSVADPGVSVDLMDEGITATLVLEADGDFFLTVVDPVEGEETFSGHWTLTDVLTLEHGGGQFEGEWQFDVVLNDDTLRLTGADAEFEFDGASEPAKLNLTATRD